MNKSIKDLLTECDDQMENANYDSQIGLAENIYNGIKRYVPDDKRRKVAELICQEILHTI